MKRKLTISDDLTPHTLEFQCIKGKNVVCCMSEEAMHNNYPVIKTMVGMMNLTKKDRRRLINWLEAI